MSRRQKLSPNPIRFRPRLETLERRLNPSISTALGDINGDGVVDLISATGPGQAGQVCVLSGLDGSTICSFAPFDKFQGGLVVAAGNFTGGSGSPLEVVVGAMAGGGPRVDIFQITPANANNPVGVAQRVGGLFAFDRTFSGGVSIAAGDTNSDGLDELVVGAGPGGGPHVKVFQVTQPSGSDLKFDKIDGFYAYPKGFVGGVQVAVGNLNADSAGEIVTGAGAGGGPHVKVFQEGTHNELASFYAFNQGFTGGVFVGTGNYGSTPGVTRQDIVVGAGAGGGPRVSVFALPANKATPPTVLQNFFAFGSSQVSGGVRVSGTGNTPLGNGLIATSLSQTGTSTPGALGSAVNVYPGAYKLGGATPVALDEATPFGTSGGVANPFQGFSYSVTIPLSWVNSAPSGTTPTFRLGLNASFPNSLNKGSYTYLLDTGSTGIYVPWQIATGGSVPPGGTTFSQDYGSGITYTAVNQANILQFTDPQGNDYGVQGMVNYGSIVQSSIWTDQSLAQDLQSGTPPDQNAFWGTFGMDTQASTTSPGSLFNSLIQMPGNLGKGFIINSGGAAIFQYANQLNPSDWVRGVIPPSLLAQLNIPIPTLTIGLNSYNRNGFQMISPPTVILTGKSPIAPQTYTNPDGSTYSNGTFVPTVLNDKSYNSTITITGPGGPPLPYSTTGTSIYTVFDTGESDSTLYTDIPNVPNSLINDQFYVNAGLNFVQTMPNPQPSATNPSPPTTNLTFLNFVTGTTSNLNQVAYTPANRNSFNTGIAFFLQFQVMYDIQNTAMGFAPTGVSASS